MLADIANEAEEKFQNFMYEQGDKRDLVEQLADSDFQSNFTKFFESAYGGPLHQIQGKIDQFSQYLEQNVHNDMSDEVIKSMIDSYPYPVKPELLFGLGQEGIQQGKECGESSS